MWLFFEGFFFEGGFDCIGVGDFKFVSVVRHKISCLCPMYQVHVGLAVFRTYRHSNSSLKIALLETAGERGKRSQQHFTEYVGKAVLPRWPVPLLRLQAS